VISRYVPEILSVRAEARSWQSPEELQSRGDSGGSAFLMHWQEEGASYAMLAGHCHSLFTLRPEGCLLRGSRERIIAGADMPSLLNRLQQLLKRSLETALKAEGTVPEEILGRALKHIGAAGYLAYDPGPGLKRPEVLAEWGLFYSYFFFDLQDQTLWSFQLEYDRPGMEDAGGLPDWGKLPDRGKLPVQLKDPGPGRDQYVRQVETIRRAIFRGDVYEVNLSRRREHSFRGDPARLYRILRSQDRAPFAAFLRFPARCIISASPELFLHAEGLQVQTRPIKGTRPRGTGPASDAALKEELLVSEKEAAELNMITDLLRNDLSKVSLAGTVRVQEPRRIDAYPTVWQCSSLISSTLQPGTGYGELLGAAVPGGSITGCPKQRSLEIIDELEAEARGAYTGNAFIMGAEGLISSILIRSLFLEGTRLFSHAGGAVTWASDAEEEYIETEAKFAAIDRALQTYSLA